MWWPILLLLFQTIGEPLSLARTHSTLALDLPSEEAPEPDDPSGETDDSDLDDEDDSNLGVLVCSRPAIAPFSSRHEFGVNVLSDRTSAPPPLPPPVI